MPVAVLTGLLALAVMPLARAQDRDADAVLKTTMRLRLQTVQGNETITGHGSAFAVDLASLGLPQPRYLLSAAHLVLDHDSQRLSQGTLTVEVEQGGGKAWKACKVVAVDRQADLCLLQSPVNLPVLARLGSGEEAVGCPLLIVGCPKGVLPRISTARLTSKQPNVRGQLWEASGTFWHGNSGGPVFDARSHALTGVAVAGVMDESGDMDGRTALFTPVSVIRKFLDSAVRRTPHGETAAAR